MKFVKIFAAGLCLFSAVVVSLNRTEDTLPAPLAKVECKWKLIGEDCKDNTKCDRKSGHCKRKDGENCIITDEKDSECLNGSFCKPYDKSEILNGSSGKCKADSMMTKLKKTGQAISNVGEKVVAGAKAVGEKVAAGAKAAGGAVVNAVNGAASTTLKTTDKIVAKKQ